MGSTKLNFNDKIRRIPQKALTRTHLTWQDVMMIKLQVTNPEWSGVMAYPFKDLPVMWIEDELTHGGEEGVVMCKGTIVSLLTMQTSITHGIPVPTSSGTVPWYVDAVDSDTVNTYIDDAAYGYPEGIVALMVPANGGATSVHPYSSDDTDLNGWNSASTSNLSLGANIPCGIVMENIYQDIRGAFLNYQTHDAYSTIIEGRLDVPFVDLTKFTTFGTDADVAAATDSAYALLRKKWQFLSFSSGSDCGSGSFIKSDKYGKMVIESGAVTANPTIQTVGRVLTYDCRYPRDLSATIQNYSGITAMGTVTEGVPVDLFVFAQSALEKASLLHAAVDVVHRIQEGMFGYARIQLIKG